MEGFKGSTSFSYVEQAGYDKFESRNYLGYGNGTGTWYTYDAYNRHLIRLHSVTGDNHDMMINVYTRSSS